MVADAGGQGCGAPQLDPSARWTVRHLVLPLIEVPAAALSAALAGAGLPLCLPLSLPPPPPPPPPLLPTLCDAAAADADADADADAGAAVAAAVAAAAATSAPPSPDGRADPAALLAGEAVHCAAVCARWSAPEEDSGAGYADGYTMRASPGLLVLTNYRLLFYQVRS
jgi:hypothetical protein